MSFWPKVQLLSVTSLAVLIAVTALLSVTTCGADVTTSPPPTRSTHEFNL
jgi:hypothetical protein